MVTLLSIATALFAGLMMTRLFSRFKLPDVTAYLIAGILAGPFVLGRLGIPGLGFVSNNDVEALSVFSDVALGFIAFSIGSEFNLTALRKTGRQAAIIGIVQAVFTTVVVDLAMISIHFLMPQTLSLPAAITLGAIAAATAPAATLMVVRQYKAKGELTSLLLPIVALDDAVGLILFAVSFGIAKALSSGRADLISILADPLLEIVLSLLLGAAAGMVLKKLETMFHSNSNRLSMTITFIILTVGLSMLSFKAGPVTALVCSCSGTVLRIKRRRLQPLRLQQRQHHAYRTGIYPDPLPREIRRRAPVFESRKLQQGSRPLSWHHALSAGRRRARHVRDCRPASRRRPADPKYHPLHRSGL